VLNIHKPKSKELPILPPPSCKIVVI
jgi:hypothetical protein